MTADTPPSRIRAALRKCARILAGAALALVLAAGGGWLFIEGDGNVHVVVPATVLRSAQLGAEPLRRVIEAQHVRSILNLRGDNHGARWYDDELGVARAEGVQHIDFRMSALHRLDVAQMQQLLDTIQRAPKPLLIHCNGGADRTGLASALFVLASGQPADAARRQLSLRYGHFPWLGSRSVAMDESFDAFVAARASSSAGER